MRAVKHNINALGHTPKHRIRWTHRLHIMHSTHELVSRHNRGQRRLTEFLKAHGNPLFAPRRPFHHLTQHPLRLFAQAHRRRITLID